MWLQWLCFSVKLDWFKDKKANTLTFLCTCRYCNLAISGDNKTSCLSGEGGKSNLSQISLTTLVVYSTGITIWLDNKSQNLLLKGKRWELPINIFFCFDYKKEKKKDACVQFVSYTLQEIMPSFCFRTSSLPWLAYFKTWRAFPS